MTGRTVGFLCAMDPLDVHSFSGTLLHMLRALESAGWRVELLGRDMVRQSRWTHGLGRIRERLGLAGRPSAHDIAKHRAQILDDLRRGDASVVFAPVASPYVAEWDADVPIVHSSDATPRLLHGGYDDGVGPVTDDDLRAQDAIERRALQRADAAVLSSQWAADSAVRDYGADRAKVHVVPLGANVPGGADEEAIRNRPLDGTCELLFIGKYWQRKGGDLAVAAAEVMNRRGIRTRLHIVGSRPERGPLPDCVVDHGFLSKADASQRAALEQLSQSCHLFVLPTRADCTPVSINEANAYGLPALSTTTGGVPSVIRPGETGELLPLDASAEAWADAIATLWADRDRYVRMALAAREHYEARLSWHAWGRAMDGILGGLVSP
jgi:glycosyltransferase involved in cell wall biosynthesis